MAAKGLHSMYSDAMQLFTCVLIDVLTGVTGIV